MAPEETIEASRPERILATMVASAVGLSVVCFFAMLIGTGLGVRNFSEGAWPIVISLPMVGLPLGFLLLLSLLIVNGLRRKRSSSAKAS